MFRDYYWGNRIEGKVVSAAYSKGLDGIKTWTLNRLDHVLRPPQHKIFRDGTQTPFGGNIGYYAQHATGTCCRRCVEEWHGINRTTEIVPKDLEYFSELIQLYVRSRLPSISNQGGERPPGGEMYRIC